MRKILSGVSSWCCVCGEGYLEVNGQHARAPQAEVGGPPHSGLSKLFTQRRLSPTQRRLARYIIDHPREAPFLSGVELAKRVGVSQPSVTRLASTLGYKRYAELQKDMRGLILSASGDAELSNKFQSAVADEIGNLEALKDYLAEPSKLQGLGRHLAKSEPLCVLGLRVSAPLTGYFGYFARKICTDVCILTDGGSTIFDMLAHARRAGGEWILCFLLPRYPRETLEALVYARTLGFRVATVTDRASAPVAQVSDMILPTGVGTQFVFDSHAAAVVLAGALLEAIADAFPDKTHARLEDFEQRAVEMRMFAAQ